MKGFREITLSLHPSPSLGLSPHPAHRKKAAKAIPETPMSLQFRLSRDPYCSMRNPLSLKDARSLLASKSFLKGSSFSMLPPVSCRPHRRTEIQAPCPYENTTSTETTSNGSSATVHDTASATATPPTTTYSFCLLSLMT